MDGVYADMAKVSDEKILALRNLPRLGGLSGAVKPAWYKQAEQAERNFVNALLRRESGAAIAAVLPGLVPQHRSTHEPS